MNVEHWRKLFEVGMNVEHWRKLFEVDGMSFLVLMYQRYVCPRVEGLVEGSKDIVG